MTTTPFVVARREKMDCEENVVLTGKTEPRTRQ